MMEITAYFEFCAAAESSETKGYSKKREKMLTTVKFKARI
jgi:hypothetical protein